MRRFGNRHVSSNEGNFILRRGGRVAGEYIYVEWQGGRRGERREFSVQSWATAALREGWSARARERGEEKTGVEMVGGGADAYRGKTGDRERERDHSGSCLLENQARMMRRKEAILTTAVSSFTGGKGDFENNKLRARARARARWGRTRKYNVSVCYPKMERQRERAPRYKHSVIGGINCTVFVEAQVENMIGKFQCPWKWK